MGDWTDATFDLAAYAGQTVKLRFAYVCDDYVYEAGWKVDAIKVGPSGAPVFSDDVETVKPQIAVDSNVSWHRLDEAQRAVGPSVPSRHVRERETPSSEAPDFGSGPRVRSCETARPRIQEG